VGPKETSDAQEHGKPAVRAGGTSAWAQEIVIGQSVALSGSNADIGRDMRDGALAVFAKFNVTNPIGRRVKLVTLR
jgi:ABC-type branched-subunit amino acid transport system substrate-binding protein